MRMKLKINCTCNIWELKKKKIQEWYEDSRLHLQGPPFPVYPEAPKGQLPNENAQVIVNQMTAETLRI